MRACGVSLYRAAVPLLLCCRCSGAAGCSCSTIACSRTPTAAPRRSTTRSAARAPHTVNALANRNWLVDKRRPHLPLPVSTTREPADCTSLSVFEPSAKPPYRLAASTRPRRRWRRSSGRRSGAAERGWVQKLPVASTGSSTSTFVRRPLLDSDAAERFSARATSDSRADDVRRAARAHRRAERDSGFSARRTARRASQRKLAFPLVTIVMTLLGVPFGVTTGRRGALYGIGLAIDPRRVAYWLVNTFFLAVGQAGLLPARARRLGRQPPVPRARRPT